MAEKVYLTKEKIKELKERLEYLKTVKRPEITEKIKIARDFGDLSENFEYHAAKEEQGMIEGEIIEIETQLKYVVVIDESEKKKGTVSLGSKVEIVINGKKQTFEIVGTAESDVLNNKISNESPIGKAILGQKAGDVVVADTPSGKTEIRIEKVL